MQSQSSFLVGIVGSSTKPPPRVEGVLTAMKQPNLGAAGMFYGVGPISTLEGPNLTDWTLDMWREDQCFDS